MEAQLLTVPQVARLFGCAESTLYMMVQQGRISCIRLWGEKGRCNAIRFTPELITEHLKANTVRPRVANGRR